MTEQAHTEKVEIRSATREEIASFFPKLDCDSMTLKVWAGFIDGEVAAMAGFVYLGGYIQAFMNIKNERARHYRLAMVKTARAIMADAKASGYRFVYAEANAEERNAPRFLESLGFRRDSIFSPTYVWSATQ